MRRQLKVLAILSAWFMAIGGHWDVLQVIAWGRMLVSNSGAMSLGAAVARTFDPEAMCPLCHTVQDGKREQRADPSLGLALAGKAPLIFQAASAVVVAAPEGSRWVVFEIEPRSQERAAPVPPPPRTSVI